MFTRSDAIFACCVAFTKDPKRVLHAKDVTASLGTVTDWRYEKAGHTLLADADAFDTAVLFVDLVGYSPAYEAATTEP